MMEGIHDIRTLSGTAKHRAIQQLRNNMCVCGQGKSPGYPFCVNCKGLLTPELRRDLGRMLTDNYVTAYHDAERHLADIREDKMWKHAGTYRFENVQQVFERWGKASLYGSLITITGIVGAVWLHNLTTRHREREAGWTAERKTA